MKKATSDDYKAKFLTVEKALQAIYQDLPIIQAKEQLAIRTALGRILAEDVQSQIAVPPHQNSAMDGYAVRGTDLPSQDKAQFNLVGTSMAGLPCSTPVQANQCIRIFTGAVIPTGADTVIMQEHVSKQDDIITIEAGHKLGQHVRAVGEDIDIGQVVFKTGKQLSPADIGMLASLGIPEVNVWRRLRVAFFSTGDELCSVGENLGAGQIYDSNRYSIYSMLTRLGIEMVDMGVVRDKPADIEAAFLTAANCSDVIITSGGVSVGDADYVTETLHRLGKVDFWKVAMKPGKPLTYGKIQQAVFFGLPGNPVSAMVTFYQIVQPALRRMMGHEQVTPIRITVPCVSDLKKSPGRVEFQRGILETDTQECLFVRSTGKQGSGILSSMSQANCFIVLPLDCGNVTAGSEVLVEPFASLI